MSINKRLTLTFIASVFASFYTLAAVAATTSPTNIGLSATSAGSEQLKAVWTASSGDTIRGYEVQIFESDNNAIRIGSVQVDGTQTSVVLNSYISTSGSIKTLRNGISYQIKVVAIGASANSSPSSFSSPASPYGLPSNVVNPEATRVGPGSIHVTWDPPANDGGAAVTSYRITCSPACSSSRYQTTTENEFTASGLDFSSEYSFKIQAVNARGASSLSSATATNLVTPFGGVDAPQIAVTATSSLVTASWDAVSVDGASRIEYLAQLVDADSGDDIGSLKSGSSLSQTFVGVTVGKKYQVRVTTVADSVEGSAGISGVVTIPFSGTTSVDASLTSPVSPKKEKKSTSISKLSASASASPSPAETLSPNPSESPSPEATELAQGSPSTSSSGIKVAVIVIGGLVLLGAGFGASRLLRR